MADNLCTCGMERLPTIGPSTAPFLIIGDEPKDEDYKAGMIFSGKRGELMNGELTRVGLQLRSARLMCVHMHPEPDSFECKAGFLEALREMRGRKGVLLMGAQACAAFGIEHVSNLYGLVVESNPYFPRDVGFVMVAPAPPTADLIGEFRLTIEKFAKKLKEV